jgi:hypothetical protein
MAAFNSVDIEAFQGRVTWARKQAQATPDRNLRDEYISVALAYERLIKDIERQGPVEEIPY